MFGLGNRTTSRARVGSSVGRNGMLRTAALAGLGMMAYRWFRNRQATTAEPATRKPESTTRATDPKDVW